MTAVMEPEVVVDETTSLDDSEVAHIVRTEPGENAAAKVTEARVLGTPIEALCGYVWIPSKDPQRLHVCSKCRDIYEGIRSINDGLPETPRS